MKPEWLDDMGHEAGRDTGFLTGRTIFPAGFVIDLNEIVHHGNGVGRAGPDTGLAVQASG